MNAQEHLVHEFERIVIIRENIRNKIRIGGPVMDAVLLAEMERALAMINVLIVDTKTALSSNDALEVLTMIDQIGMIP